MPKDFVVFFRRNVTPRQPDNDCAVRERQLPLPVGIGRYIVAEDGASIVVVACFVGTEITPPVAVCRRDCDALAGRAVVFGDWKRRIHLAGTLPGNN